jgi:hypothetical protein
MIDISKVRWVKNVKHQGGDKDWAYNEIHKMCIPEAKIFRLYWKSCKDRYNAQQPYKGDQMLLLQCATVTHVVEFLDKKVYGNLESDWGAYRIVQAVWMPPEGFVWENLPHQRELFGFDYVVGDGQAHSLTSASRMPQFQKHWNSLGGLSAFQKHVDAVFTKINQTSA